MREVDRSRGLADEVLGRPDGPRRPREIILDESRFAGREEAPGISVDPAGSKDRDDAIWIERDGTTQLLHVTIADVAELIEIDSTLDIRASELAYTTYRRSEAVNPMLPKVLSEGLLSLEEGQERLGITVTLPFGSRMQIGEPSIRKTWIRPAKCFSYEEFDESLRDASTEHHEKVNELTDLSLHLAEMRASRGAFSYYDFSKGLMTTEDGFIVRVDPKTMKGQVVIQEMMILANETVAGFIARHEARAIYRNHSARTPTSPKVLLSEFTKAMALGSAQGEEFMTHHLQLCMNRACYGSAPEGHFALCLPVYLHFTSPIRRYADLVNARILRALLDSGPLPYSEDELDRLAGHINEVSDAERERRAAHYRAAALRKSDRELQAEGYDALPPSEYGRIVKAACVLKGPNPGFIEGFLRRQQEAALRPEEYYRVFFESPQTAEWLDVRKRILERIPANVACEVLTMLAQKEGIEPPAFSVGRLGSDHNPRFNASARMSREGEEIVSGISAAGRRKDAEYEAARDLLCRLIGISVEPLEGVSLPDTCQFADPEMPIAAAIDRNWKGALQERCAKLGIGLPEYQHEKSGPPHQQVFSTVVRISWQGDFLEGQAEGLRTLKEAEHAAAQALLEKMEEGGVGVHEVAKAPQMHDPEVPVAVVIDRNWKGILQERCVELRIAPPQYECENYGPGHQQKFSALARITWRGNVIEGRAAGLNSRKGAEHAAAQALLEIMEQGRIGSSGEPAQLSTSADAEGQGIWIRPDWQSDPVAALTEYCQAAAIALPECQYSDQGPRHRRVWHAICSIVLPSGERVERKDSGPDKAMAKRHAAAAVMKHIVRQNR